MAIISDKISLSELRSMAKNVFGDLVKAVVDVETGVIALDAELHSDLEGILLQNGSLQKNLWGINLYPGIDGEDFIEFNSKFLSWAKEGGVKIAFNPGMYELKAGIGQIKNILENTDLIIVNKEEAESLVFEGSIRVEENVKKLLNGLFKLGPNNVVITNGKEGAYLFDGKEYLYMKTFPGNRIEMTGAGDSFSSGLLSALIYGKDIGEGLRWGAANSASVIQKVGAIERLLTKEQMEKTLQDNKSVVPVLI